VSCLSWNLSDLLHHEDVIPVGREIAESCFQWHDQGKTFIKPLLGTQKMKPINGARIKGIKILTPCIGQSIVLSINLCRIILSVLRIKTLCKFLLCETGKVLL